jgi:hypothetical protein
MIRGSRIWSIIAESLGRTSEESTKLFKKGICFPIIARMLEKDIWA